MSILSARRLLWCGAALFFLSTAAFANTTSVQLYYDPLTGNLKLQNTTASAVEVQSFDIITLGNGTQGAATPNNQGYLIQAAATLPAAALTISNTSSTGVNGLSSQAYVANFGSALFTLQPYAGWSAGSPIGPAGTFFDLGNIATLGMTQSNLDARFLTDAESTPPNYDTSLYGKFLYTFRIGSGDFSENTPGNVVATVPEPSTVALLAIAAGCVGFVVRRRRVGSNQ